VTRPPDSAPPGGDSTTVARGISWVGAGHVVGQLAWYGSLLFIASLVPPGSFGSVAVALVVVQVAWLLVGSGTRAALVVSPDVSRAQVRRAVAANVSTGVAVAAVAAIAAGPLLRLLTPSADSRVLEVLAVAIALFGFSIVPLALLQKAMEFKRHAAVNAGAAVIASAVAVAAALAGLGVWALVVRQVLFQALLAGLGWIAVRGLLPEARDGETPARRDPVAWWFFALGVIAFLSFNVDYVVVGHFTDVTQVGLYSLAFAIAFAPLTQFAWQVGKVLFASAARTEDPAELAARAARSARLTAVLVWPLIAVALVVAPLVLPLLLGPEWQPMVTAFELLLVAGAVHAVLAVLREHLLGGGNVRSCFAVDAVWLVATAGALLALVPVLGVVGAAVAHVALLLPLTAAYVTLAVRRLGLRPAVLWGAMRLPMLAVAAQIAMTLLETRLVEWAGGTPALAAAVGACAGGITLLLLFSGAETPPHRELAAAVGMARLARGPAPARLLPDRPVTPSAPRPTAAVLADTPPASGARLAPAALALAALIAGGAAVREPRPVAGLVLGGLALLLAFRVPVVHLLALIALTTIVPLDVQARFGSGGDAASAGVLPSDVLLLAGFVRAAFVLPHLPLRRVARAAGAITALFLVAAAAQLLHAMALGRPLSGAGGEFRALLGLGTLLIALPVLADGDARRRLLTGLAGLAIALGVWGVVQFAAHLQFYDEPDSPIAAGSFLTAGRVVGLFAFPVAAIVALAVLTAGPQRARGLRAALWAVVLVNCAALVLTFERTFVLALLVGLVFVFLRSGARQRVRLVVGASAAAAATALALVGLAPAASSAYAARVASISSARYDPAVQYRVEEGRQVGEEIRRHPLAGSALGATIIIGRPGTNRELAPRRYAENGYLWLAWKTGLPAAALLCGALALAVVAPAPRREARPGLALRRGCQAALVALLAACVTFSCFNQIGATAMIGLLTALCVAAAPAGAREGRVAA
jgi:O-antigen/teichoic acid export membrane protein